MYRQNSKSQKKVTVEHVLTFVDKVFSSFFFALQTQNKCIIIAHVHLVS